MPSARDRLTADQREWRNLIHWCTSEVGAREALVNTPEEEDEPSVGRSRKSARNGRRRAQRGPTRLGRSSISVTAAAA